MLRKPFTEIDQKILTVEQSLVASHFLRERPGPGDGERKTLLIRQIAFEPLPASVLLGDVGLRLGMGRNGQTYSLL